jgi:hypothetical protein
MLEMEDFIELNSDQRREVVNTRQRFQAWRNAVQRERSYRGSMVWGETGGELYLLRSYYDERGNRKQKSLGRKTSETEAAKTLFDTERQEAIASRKRLDAVVERQAAINRALGLGRVPELTARILRQLDQRGLLGRGLRVVGTNALYAYEAACGVFLDSSLTATEDIDLLFDARSRLYLIADEEVPPGSLLQILKYVDRSFRRTRQSFRAENDEGYFVDLIKPLANPPWRGGKSKIGAADDLEAAEIEGLVWLENAPAFEQMAIDERGVPLRIVAPDPRAFAVHKYWISTRANRNPVKKRRDEQQARAIARLLRSYLVHLSFTSDELRYLPKDVIDSAATAFAAGQER